MEAVATVAKPQSATAGGDRPSLAHPRAGHLASEPTFSGLPALKVPSTSSGARPTSSPVSARRGLVQQQLGASAPPDVRMGSQGAQLLIDLDDSEMAQLGLEGAPELAVSVSPTKAASSRAATSRALAPGKKNYGYARKAPPPDACVVLTKETMELELRQMKSFNREVYEARVREKYLEEALTRKLYTQNIAMRRHERLTTQRGRTDERVQREFALGTPFLQIKAHEADAKALAAHQRAASAPQFADVAAIQEHLAAANLASRRVTPQQRIAKPSSVKDLAVQSQKEVPPTTSLMNPRNQVTSPLPPKEVLLPWVPARSDGDGAGADGGPSSLSRGAAKALLAILPTLFDAKRIADLDAERRHEPRPSLPTVVRDHLMRTTRDASAAREKLAALRFACSTHVRVPRVAIFHAMMGWGSDGMPWDATKAAACLLLMLWLQPPADEATKVAKKFVSHEVAQQLIDDAISLELKISDVDLVLKHLQRKRLVSAKGAAVLAEEAARLVLPPSEEAKRSVPVVDVDQLLLRWMGVWGTWEWKEDAQLLVSILSKFQPRARSPGKSPTKRRSP